MPPPHVTYRSITLSMPNWQRLLFFLKINMTFNIYGCMLYQNKIIKNSGIIVYEKKVDH
jgi:hypothetical protein